DYYCTTWHNNASWVF
nr:immunoglobulin light chain junction region [Macaca mulatta]